MKIVCVRMPRRSAQSIRPGGRVFRAERQLQTHWPKGHAGPPVQHVEDRQSSTEQTLKPHASNRAGAATLGARGCNSPVRPNRTSPLAATSRPARAGAIGQRRWATMKRHQAGNGLMTWLQAKAGKESRRRGVPKGRNVCRTRRLMSVWQRTRAARGNLAQSIPRETGDLWIAQACNGTPRGCCAEFRRAKGMEPWFVVDDANDE